MPQAQWPKVFSRTFEGHLKTINNVHGEVFHNDRGNISLHNRLVALEKARDQACEAVRRLEGRVDRLEEGVFDLVTLIKLLHKETCDLCSEPKPYAERQVAVLKTFLDKVEEWRIGEKTEKE